MVSVFDLPKIQNALAEIFHPGSFSGWVLLNYHDENTVQLESKGPGGVEELRPHLREDQCQYMLISFYEKKDGLDCNRDVYIAWTGPKVSKIKAAKKMTHFGDLKILLSPNHAQLTATNINNFNEATIRAKALPDSGSHIID